MIMNIRTFMRGSEIAKSPTTIVKDRGRFVDQVNWILILYLINQPHYYLGTHNSHPCHQCFFHNIKFELNSPRKQ